MQLFTMRLKYLLRSKGSIFWTFGFPLILGTFFYLAFGTITEDSYIKTTDLYVVNGDEHFIEFLSGLTYEDSPLYNVITDRDKESLEEDLINQRIDGYIYIEDDQIVYRLNENGITQTITKSIIEHNRQIDHFIKTYQNDTDKFPRAVSSIAFPINFLSESYSETDAKASRLIIYFYALIASQTMYGAFWGIGIVNDLQANMSSRGIRMGVSPTHKLKLISIHFLAALLIHFAGSQLLLVYLKYVLGVSFGDQTVLIILSQLVGCISGIAFGALASSLLKGSNNTREAIISLMTTFLGFLAGLMSVHIKYLIDKFLPFVRYINPVSLLTDALYSLYYYNELTNYFKNLSILALISILFVAIAYFRLRGTKYDSI